MDVVKKIEQLILLEELYNTVNVDEPFFRAILVLNFVENVENHVLLIVLEIVAFLFFSFSVDS